MSVTLLQNLVNPEIFADSIADKLTLRLFLRGLAHIQNFQGQPGSSIKVPRWAALPEADDVDENVAIVPANLSATYTQLTVKKLATAVQLTDEAVLNALEDPVAHAEERILAALAGGLDTKMMAALNSIDGTNGTRLYDATAVGKVDASVVSKALSKFGEDQDGEKYLLVNSKELENLRDVNAKTTYVPVYQTSAGNIGLTVVDRIFDCNVVALDRVDPKSAFIVKPGAIGLYLKRDVQVEMQRDILKKLTVISADVHYATHLRDATKAVKIKLAN